MNRLSEPALIRKILLNILIYVIGGFLTFSFGVIFVFLSYPALNIYPHLARQREGIVGFGLIIPTVLASWLISLLLKYRGWKTFVPPLGLGFVVGSLILIGKRYLTWFPDDWLIFTPWGIILVIISAFLGRALIVRGRTLIYLTLIFILFYIFSHAWTQFTKNLSNPVHSYDLRIPNENIMLGATLTIPKSSSLSKWPGILLISGSGKQDRDETFGIFNATFKEMALFLSENGFVTIRYDKRGVGQSGGDFTSAGLYDFARDAENVFNYLKSRKEVNPSQIFFIGHSYGGKAATIVASRHPEIAGLVLLACVASPEPDNLIRQNKFISDVRGESAEERKARFEDLNSWIEKVRNHEYKDYKDYFGPGGLSRKFQERQKFNPFPPLWMLQAMEYSQLKTLEGLKMPILVISGTSDWMVPPSETKLLQRALERAHHPDFEVSIFPEVDHRFIRVRSQEASYKLTTLSSIKDLFREYPLHPSVLSEILNWLKVKAKVESVIINGVRH